MSRYTQLQSPGTAPTIAEALSPNDGVWMLVIGAFHSDERVVALAHQWSRRCRAVVKYFSTARASLLLSALWNRFSSATNASSERERFLRFASAMSRHISGEPEAMRVVSRKPVAHKAACVFEC